MSNLALHKNTCLVSRFYHLLRHRNIRIQVIHRAVHHDRSKPCANGPHDGFIAVIMVTVKTDWRLHFARQLLHHCSIFFKSGCMLDCDMLWKQHDNRRRVCRLRCINHRPCHHIIHTDKCDRSRITLFCRL